jgi:hypothetical protein
MLGCRLLLVAVAALALDPASAGAQSPPPAPCSAPEHRQFDFWVGEWNVTTPDGKPAGTNRIEKIAGSCALLENWTGAGGGSGKSINFWSPEDGKWHQTWAGSFGSFLFLSGAFADGAMRMEGMSKDAKGKATLERITWTPLAEGRLRQHWQQSADGGKTWTDAFVGLYSRKE